MKPGYIITTLIAVVVGLQLVSLFTVTQTTRANTLEQSKLSTVHTLESYTKNLTNQIQQFLTPIDSQLSIVRQLAEDGLMNTQDNRTLELFFLSQLRSNLLMNAMYLGRYDGSFVAVVRFNQPLSSGYQNQVLRAKVVSVVDGARKIEWREYALSGALLNEWSDHKDSYDPRMLDWYKSARVHDKPVWTNAFSLTENNRLAIAASVNLQNKRQDNVGVLGVSVELSELNRLVANLPDSAVIKTVVLDDQLNKIAVSIPAAMLGSKQGATSIEQWSDGPHDRAFDIDKHWFSKGNKFAAVRTRIHLFDGALQWYVLTQSKVMHQVNSDSNSESGLMNRTIAVIVLPGLIAIIAIFGLSERLQRLYRRATVDYLTKAFNREEFINRFTKRLYTSRLRSSRSERWVGVLLDLDGFKQINDTHGHDAGDAILTTVVCRLQQIVGRAGFVGRLGGDEFAIALRLKPDVNANKVVERLRRSVIDKPISSARAQHHIGMTAGVAIADSRETVEQLLERADRALVAGKSVEKNMTYGAFYQEERDRRANDVIIGRVEELSSEASEPLNKTKNRPTELHKRRRVA